jgi:hypothetical protein
MHALKCYLFLRLFTSAIILAASFIAPPAFEPSDPAVAARLGAIENLGSFSRLFLAPWYRWDSVSFVDIAENGYASNLVNTARPPLYPLLTRGMAVLFSPTLLAGLIVANLAAIAAMYLLYLVIADAWDEQLARESVFGLAVYPTAFFLVAAYTESLFLALSLGCLYTYKHSRWWLAALLGCAAVLTRLQGIVLAAPMVWLAAEAFFVRRERSIKELALRLAPVGLMAVAWLGYAVYVRYGLQADWPWVTLSTAWFQRVGWPWEGMVGNLRALTIHPIDTPISGPAQFFDLALVGGALALLGAAVWRRRMPAYYGLYAALTILIILVKIDNLQLLVSASRYLLVVFPIMTAAALVFNKTGKYVWYSLSIGGQMIMLVLFYWWIWVA